MLTNIRGKVGKVVLIIAEHVFTSARRVFFIALAIFATGVMYFGFWTWIGITIGAIAVLMGMAWCGEKVHPTTIE